MKSVGKGNRTSINQRIMTAVAAKPSGSDTEILIRNKAAKASSAQGLKTLAQAPDIAPEPEDRIPAGYIRPR
jgi:hypothetical protein